MNALSIQHASRFFNRQNAAPLRALDDVSFEVAAGSIHGLLGPNGAGKSTLINIIAGIIRPSGGNVEVFGADVVTQTEKSKGLLGVMPQEVVIEMAFTVEEVLYYFSGMYGVPAAERRTRIATLLEQLDLADKAKVRARTLSGGMKRRLMLAKAVLHRPKLVILDEPTAGVDITLRQKIWYLVRDLNKDGTTILFTTHYLEEAEQLCERITLIDHGRVIKDGNLKEIQKEFSKNLITFEVFDRSMAPMPGVKATGTAFSYPLTDVGRDLAAIAAYYGSNLKAIHSESASLEHVFLELTRSV